ncbi:MAG: hypothetical protein JSV89_22015, partial [Spirochaetaceae bacterium]
DDLTVGGNLNVAAGTFSTNGTSLAVSGNATVSGTLLGSVAPDQINVGLDLNVTALGTIDVNGGNLSVTGDTTVQATGWIFLNGGAFTTNDLTVFGLLEATAAGETITVNGDLDLSTPGDNFIEATSTLIMSGGGNTSLNVPEVDEEIYILDIQKAASIDLVNLASNILIRDTLRITSGTLAAGSWDIELRGDTWDNDGSKTGLGTFAPGSGQVNFTATSPKFIYGDNSWYQFLCTVDSMVLQFEPKRTQTIVAGGDISVLASDEFVRITMKPIPPDDTAGLTPWTPPPPVPGPGAYDQHWVINVVATASATFDYVHVIRSYAINTITPFGTCLGVTDDNVNWYFVIPIEASWTVDSDSNGHIDRIRVQVQATTILSDIFDPANLEAVVQGYTVLDYDTGGQGGDDVFDIILVESPYLDTDATPSWQLLRNEQPVRFPLPPPTGLYGLGGALVASGTDVYVPDDGARPVIAYTLAVVGETKAYLHFSEPVFTDSTATNPIVDTDFTYSGGSIVSLTPLEMSGNGAHAAMIEFANPLSDTDVVALTPQRLNAVNGEVWDVPYIVDPTGGGAYLYTNTDGNLPPSGNDYMDDTIQHRVSDVALNLIEPVFAFDAVTQRDPVRGGIGRITRFDGTAFLQDRDIQLQARILSSINPGGSTVDIVWDVNPTDPILLSNLWVVSQIPPSGAPLRTVDTMTHNPPGAPGDTYHNPNTAARSAAQTLASGPLRDFVIPASDPEIQDGADLQFIFVIDPGGGQELLPYARIPNPGDPRTARPWVIKIRDLRTQRGDFTVTNNVINPLRGETVKVTYSIPQTGMVTINVFDLKGDIVDVLYRGQRTAGEYSTSWDGRNRGNRVVARGVYFIKIVGPGISEIRKVLVVK